MLFGRTFGQRSISQVLHSTPLRRGFSTTPAMVATEVKRLGVVGAGQMGLGIALVAAQKAQIPVTLVDSSQASLDKGLKFADKLLEKDVSKSRLSQSEADDARSRLEPSTKIEDLSSADFVIEAVPEILDLKTSIFSQLAQIAPSHAILATNTSSISITKIAASTTPKDNPTDLAAASRVISTHFMNPVPVQKGVEIITGLQTSQSTIDTALGFVRRMGKIPSQSADSPGFLANRILMPYINEAIICLETGVGGREDIDNIMKNGTNVPMGPLQLADFVGLDTCLAIMKVLHTETGDSKYRPSVLLGKMVDAGRSRMAAMEDESETALNPQAYSTVDPEVRAYVYSLVSALGGTGADEDGRYVLGDDALACLKDIKKWLKLYDEKSNRLDVARCLAEANLVNGDLLEILAAWPEEATDDRLKSKISLACVEVMVPLTWPIEKNEMQMTVNHHRHVPYLQLAQSRYKRAIIQHEALILRTAVRIILPSIALPQGERTSRDEGMIKLLLYFFRNVAMITAPQNLPIEGNESEVSRSATIEAFHKQEVLALLLTIASNMGEDFNTEDTVMLEVLFHLVKGVDVEKLFVDKEERDASNSDELKSLLRKEAGMHRSYAKTAPTRHNRFGTMIWVKRDNARGVSAVSGQDVLTDNQQTLSKMDQSKKWNKPKQRSKDTDQSSDRFDLPVPLSDSATLHLRSFIEEFLDSSFNPLFSHIRKAIEREADRVLEAHTQQFFYLVSWFLEAERVRRKRKAEATKKSKAASKITTDFEADSFALIASVLNQETFILLNRFMQDRLDMKSWREVDAGTRCFTQTLLIVQDMAESPVEEDQEIAENIQNRIFYEETTHDRIIAILRGYKDQGFGYLDSSTELAHVFLRMLERYSRENVDLQVRSRRRARKSKKAAARQRGDSVDPDAMNTSEMEDVAEAERVSKERKFDFTRFSGKFMTQGCVDTFVAFTKYYNDLTAEQLKRAHRFFYRVAFKQELSVMLFRLDIISLFYRMIKGRQGLDSAGPMFKEWDELVRQLIKRLVKKMSQRPELVVELLFSKIRSSVFYLEYGYEEQTVSSKPRAAAVLEVKGNMTKEEQVGVAVAVLYDDHIELVDWVAKTLADAASERQSWEAEAAVRRAEIGNDGDASEGAEAGSKPPSIVVIPGTPERATAMFKNSKLRLLMTLSGFERVGIDDEPGATWIIPSNVSARELHEAHDCIERNRRDPVMQYGEEDPVNAEELLRRKPAARRRVEYDDDSEGDGIVDDEETFDFPAGGPVDTRARKKDALAELKKKRRKGRAVAPSDEENEGFDDAAREARRRARLEADLEKRRKIKSAQLVGDSDDDSEADADFFRKEEERRRGQAGKIMEALNARSVDKEDDGRSKKGKRKSAGGDALGGAKRKKARKVMAEEEENDDVSMGDSSPPARGVLAISSEDEESDTPLSSPHVGSSQSKGGDLPGRQGVQAFTLDGRERESADEVDEGVFAARAMRPRRAVLPDDSDEDD